jgi:hypothetical protein
MPSDFNFPWEHLAAQMYHEKPVLGGFVGRIPRSLITTYKEDPFMRTLLAVEEGASPPPLDKSQGVRAIRDLKIRYVLIYPAAMRPDALRFVLESLPLEPLALTGEAQLYRVIPTT